MSAADTQEAYIDTIAEWVDGDRRLAVVIEAQEIEGGGVNAPTICVLGARVEWDDLTADQARSLGEFLSTALPKAADQLDSL